MDPVTAAQCPTHEANLQVAKAYWVEACEATEPYDIPSHVLKTCYTRVPQVSHGPGIVWGSTVYQGASGLLSQTSIVCQLTAAVPDHISSGQ